jgi:hypothetical protein
VSTTVNVAETPLNWTSVVPRKPAPKIVTVADLDGGLKLCTSGFTLKFLGGSAAARRGTEIGPVVLRGTVA